TRRKRSTSSWSRKSRWCQSMTEPPRRRWRTASRSSRVIASRLGTLRVPGDVGCRCLTNGYAVYPIPGGAVRRPGGRRQRRRALLAEPNRGGEQRNDQKTGDDVSDDG